MPDNRSHEETDDGRTPTSATSTRSRSGAEMGSGSTKCCSPVIAPSKLLAVVPLADFIIFRNYVSVTEGMQKPA
jgi:hypothetical protein